MFEEQTFLDQLLAGHVSLETIDDFVDRWHDGKGQGELHEYLGMTREEYGLWLRDPDMISVILGARRDRRPLLEAVNDNVEQVRTGGHAVDVDKLLNLQAWLRMYGKSS